MFNWPKIIDLVKLLLPIFVSGITGYIISEFTRRHRSKLQSIPLIERVNRQVNLAVEGFTLARIVTDLNIRRLEEVKDLREYQLTMRNTSYVHLQDAEVQFEFSADDVQGWASRPALSKTALTQLDAAATEPWNKAFRWKIPHLPSGDSIEFNFRAVNPSSETFEAILYRAEGIVFERVVGEPRVQQASFFRSSVAIPIMATLLVIVAYQNLVTVPRISQELASSRAPVILSPIFINAHDTNRQRILTEVGQNIALSVDLPPRGGYLSYRVDLLNPSNSLETSQVIADPSPASVTFTLVPKQAGAYAIRVNGIAASGKISELYRRSFEVVYR